MRDFEPAFWGNIAQWVGAIATSLAVFMALFGDWARSKLWSPRIGLSLPNQRGELTTETHKVTKQQNQARYYHLRVSNPARWPVARDVRILLIRLEDIGPDGQPRLVWAHDDGIPLRWRFAEIHPLLRTIGPSADADLCSVRDVGPLSLHPIIGPANLQVQYTGPTDIFLTFQARGTESESANFRVRISWDGQWAPGEAEMAQHLRLSVA